MDGPFYDNQTVALQGTLPKKGTNTPDVSVLRHDFAHIQLSQLYAQSCIIVTYPTLELPVFSEHLKLLQTEFTNTPTHLVVCVTMDLPFTLSRYKQVRKLENIVLLSDFRLRQFGEQFGVRMQNGPLAGLLAPSVLIVGEQIFHAEISRDVMKPAELKSITQLSKQNSGAHQ